MASSTKAIIAKYASATTPLLRFLALGWHLEEIHVTWAHLEKKRIKLRLYTKNHKELILAMALRRGRLKDDLESSAWRRHQDYKATPLHRYLYKYKAVLGLSVLTMMKPDLHDPNDPANTRPWRKQCSHVVLNKMGCAEEIENMLEIKVYEAGSQEEIFSSEAWGRYSGGATLVEKPCLNYPESYFASAIKDDHLWIVPKDEWLKRKRVGSQKDSMICYGQLITKIAKKMRVLTDEVLNSLSPPTYCRALDTTTPRELIDSEGRLIPEAPGPRVPHVANPRGPKPSMHDLYDRMGSIEIRQGAIERMAYRQSCHWDRYHGVLEHMARVYDVPLQGAYNPPSYD
ncbi:hypothetical protein Tco_0973891 [Tanacetum coccineum]|uniref:Uncharacterized protein n=1 Tax=Tanacetum coccineum TaxID=301880 RepID=A0ABQ5EA17_9ASTR